MKMKKKQEGPKHTESTQVSGHQRLRRFLQAQGRETGERRTDEEVERALYGTSHGWHEDDASAPAR